MLLENSLDRLPSIFNHEFSDSDGEHELKFVLSGKTIDHTQLDENNNIIKDVLINISDLQFDGINIDKLVWQHAEYAHNFNQTGPDVTEKFFGNMGCNGTVSLKFSSPIYIWLLENM